MKLSKRIISLVFAVMLISAFAIQAGAATTTYSGRYGNCLYAATTTRETNRCSGVLEATPLNGTTEEDHVLKVTLVVEYKDKNGNVWGETVTGTASTGMAANSKIYPYGVESFSCRYIINNVAVYTAATTP